MSIDERLRMGMTMIEQQLPEVDTLDAYDAVTDELKRRRRRRQAWVAAAAACVLAAAAGLALAQRSDRPVQPAPKAPVKVALLDDDGAISYVAQDGSRRTLDVGSVDRFALSEDGTKIAYVADRDSDPGGWLWIADVDGSHRERIPSPCKGCRPGLGVAWSHDDARLAYTVYTPGKQPMQLRVRTLATGDELTFAPGGSLRGPAFSPDDHTIAMVAGDEATGRESVATVDVAGGAQSLRLVSFAHVNVAGPSWSEDGRTLYFTASDETDESGTSTIDKMVRSDLFAVGADGRDERYITHAADGERYFLARPYGDRFLISRKVDDGPLVVGWLSHDGRTFSAIKDADGKPVTGSGAFLQP